MTAQLLKALIVDAQQTKMLCAMLMMYELPPDVEKIVKLRATENQKVLTKAKEYL